MKLTCKLGLHDWMQTLPEEVTYPKRGPFDPRSDAGRTYKLNMKVCVHCGKKAEDTYDPY